jgi:DNA (cytosine-5)-methyltransferase 1
MPIKVVDLFCGVGGLTHGLQLAGLNVVLGVDIDASCKYPYETNNQTRFIEYDVAQIPSKIISDCFHEGDIRILVGCAPCQPFSRYTQRYRKKGHQNDKWKLLDSFAEKISDIQPHIVSMENVPELEHEQVFHDFIGTLTQNGYYVFYKVVYCPDYGVPQIRKRLVLLASLLDDISIISPLFPSEKYKTVRDAIGDLPLIKNGDTSKADTLHYCVKMNDLNVRRIQASIQGGSWRDWDDDLKLDCHKKASGKSYGAIYGRMSWDLPSPTITTQFYGYGNGRFGHPELDRALSIREGAILQSFPSDYKFIPEDSSPNTRQLGIHIGNAVPVELGRAIGISIINHLEEVYHG